MKYMLILSVWYSFASDMNHAWRFNQFETFDTYGQCEEYAVNEKVNMLPYFWFRHMPIRNVRYWCLNERQYVTHKSEILK